MSAESGRDPRSLEDQVPALLVAWSQGDQAALESLVPLVEGELRRLASHYLQGERQGHTLQTTALVNEAYLRLMDSAGEMRWQNRAHFMAIAAQAMRRILVDSARKQRSFPGAQAAIPPIPLPVPARMGCSSPRAPAGRRW